MSTGTRYDFFSHPLSHGGIASCNFRGGGYNRRARMRIKWISVGIMAAWGLFSPVATAFAAEPTPQQTQEALYGDILQSVSDMWFLLSGISNRADADRQAPAFTALVHRICLLDDRLSGATTDSGLPMEVEAEVHEDPATAEQAERLEMMQLRILESFDDVNTEFLGICRVRCYGSLKLRKAFTEAADTGMFSEEALLLLQMKNHRLSEKETEREIARMRALVEPDRAVLQTLEQVKDAGSAQKAVVSLLRISQRLQTMIPEDVNENTQLAESARAQELAAYEPLNPLLWGIRTELVRIAALPGYDGEPYDGFSDALNVVFADLGATHKRYFDDVFDDSFRMDLNEALMQNAPTPPSNE